MQWKNGKWVAGIKFQGHRENLGRFDTEKAAAQAYDKRAKQLWQNPVLNFRKDGTPNPDRKRRMQCPVSRLKAELGKGDNKSRRRKSGSGGGGGGGSDDSASTGELSLELSEEEGAESERKGAGGGGSGGSSRQPVPSYKGQPVSSYRGARGKLTVSEEGMPMVHDEATTHIQQPSTSTSRCMTYAGVGRAPKGNKWVGRITVWTGRTNTWASSTRRRRRRGRTTRGPRSSG